MRPPKAEQAAILERKAKLLRAEAAAVESPAIWNWLRAWKLLEPMLDDGKELAEHARLARAQCAEALAKLGVPL